jgi:signal transduction histidine kinase
VTYGVAALSVTVALVVARWLDIHFVTAPVSLLLSAIMVSAWFGGVRPGLVAVGLSLLGFNYYFVPPPHSLAVEMREVPRLVIFGLSALFVGSLSAAQRSATESLRDARDDLGRTVRELRRSNEALLAENAERKRAEQALDASVKQLRALGRRLRHAQDDERRRIAQMLHETTAQDLAALKMHLARLTRTACPLSDGDRAALAESISLAERSITEIRTLSYLLHPPFLDDAGLLAALRWYAAGFSDRSGIKVHLELPENFERLPVDTETALFRVVQESLINIHRHARSETARIRLRRDGETLVLETADQGEGIPSASLEHIMGGEGGAGVGIAGMSERIEQLGGHLEITSDDHGTTVHARLPLAADAG